MDSDKKTTTRFVKGKSGNPSGRPKGATNKRKDLIASMNKALDKGAMDVLQTVIDRARRGDTRCMKMILDRLMPVHKPVDQALLNRTPIINITVSGLEQIETIEPEAEDAQIIEHPPIEHKT